MTSIQDRTESAVNYRSPRKQRTPLAWQRIYLDMFSRFFDAPNVHKDWLMVRDSDGQWVAVFYDKGRIVTEMQP